MKKFFVMFMLLIPITLWAESSILDKYINISGDTAKADILNAVSELDSKVTVKSSYNVANINLSMEMNKDIGLLLSCRPTDGGIVKATVIREKDSKRIKEFICGGAVDMEKVDQASANITYIAYNNLYKYNTGSKIIEDFVYRRANNNQNPDLTIKRYEKDDGEKDTLVSYQEIIVLIEKPAFEKFK
ncbi:MAG: hypothetical protein IJD28_03870 [Deferribacterales bacterium]|nr:hypothetical protein [Deferribacterales bacterium]